MNTIYKFVYVFSFVFSTQAMSWWVWTPGDSVDDSTQSTLVRGYEPDQPIAFSHRLHAGERKISCHYCHSAARRSKSAGIPPLNTCIGCHKVVATEKDPIKYITKKYEANEPMEWVKVHDLPDHVRFNHQVHVLAERPDGSKILECQTCHGPVETMEVVGQWAPLQMGWCIGCHIEEKIPAKDGRPAVPNAPIHCSTCHY